MHCLALFLVLSVGTFVCEAKVRAAGVRLGPNPGAAIRFRRSGLDALLDGGTGACSKYAHKTPIPDMTADVGGVRISSKGARVTKLVKPVILWKLTPPNKIAGSITFPHIGLESAFSATRKTFLSTQQDSGHMTFNASRVQVNFTAQLGEFDNGIPKVAEFQCASFLGPANLKVRDTKEQFATDVLKVGASAVRPMYNAQVCSTAKKMVLTKINSLLARVPNTFDITKSIAFKGQVKPIFGNDYLEARFYGKFITDVVSPFVPAKFVEAENADSHVAIFISDALFNDVLYQVYTNEKLQFKVDKSSQPIVYDCIRVDCQADQVACLGNVAPGLKEKYGNDATVRIEVRASKAPEVNFEQGKATFTGAGTIDLYITTATDNKESHEATAAVDISGNVQLRVHEKTLYGQIEITNTKVHIDEEHNKKWEDKISATVKNVVEKYINGDFLSKGLALKLPFGAGLSDPTVSFQPHTFQIHSGFEYEVNANGEKKK